VSERRINRIPPKMPTQLYKTYAVRSPADTHYRAALCEEVDCEAYLNGWQLRVEGLAPDLLYTAKHSARRYSVVEVGPSETYLVFEAGQHCFAVSTHRKSLERPEFYFAGRGDFRSFSTRKAEQFTRPEDWVDSFANHLDTIRTEIDKG
jgi:hypothetical protein